MLQIWLMQLRSCAGNLETAGAVSRKQQKMEVYAIEHQKGGSAPRSSPDCTFRMSRRSRDHGAQAFQQWPLPLCSCPQSSGRNLQHNLVTKLPNTARFSSKTLVVDAFVCMHQKRYTAQQFGAHNQGFVDHDSVLHEYSQFVRCCNVAPVSCLRARWRIRQQFHTKGTDNRHAKQ